MPDLIKFPIKLSVALAKYYAEKALGKEASTVIVNELGALVGETAEEKLKTFFSQEGKSQQLREAFQQADARFLDLCEDQRVKGAIESKPFLGLEALEQIAAKLPKTLDGDGWRKTLRAHFVDDWGDHLTPSQLDYAADLYYECFEPAFATTYQEMLPTIYMKIEQFQKALNEVKDDASETREIAGRIEQGVKEVADHLGATKNDWRAFIQPLDERLRKIVSDEFVGRLWLIDRVNAFLNDPRYQSGVLLLEGVAGVGKTAFMAHLVHLYKYPQLFARQFPGDANVVDAIKSLAAQLVERYATLNDYARRDRIEDDAKESTNFLQNIIDRVARELPDGEKIIIVCDGLDEAGIGRNGNPFNLPRKLPKGVYLLLAQRPNTRRIEIECEHFETLTLEANSADNQHDIELYLTEAAHKPNVAKQLREHNYTDEIFIQTLKEKSEGIWIYLYNVIAEIERDERSPLNLEKLPNGLTSYYADYWHGWRDGKRGEKVKWRTHYLPLLATLAAAQDVVSLGMLAQWAKVNVDEADELLNDKWRAYVVRRGIEGYTLFHASFRDFLTGRVAKDKLQFADTRLQEELEKAVTQAHLRIVEDCRAKCGGDFVKLVDDEYARKHIVAHLIGAKLGDEMFELVAMSDRWAKAREDKDESYTGYLIDLDQAWTWAGGELGKEIRCALIQSSIYSLASNLSPELLRQLVETGMWSAGHALDNIEQMQNDVKRADAIKGIVNVLPQNIISRALEMLKAIKDEDSRARTLGVIAKILIDDSQKHEVLDIVKTISDEWRFAKTLTVVVAILTDDIQKREALAAAKAIKNEWFRAETLVAVAAVLTDDAQKQNILSQALMAAKTIRDYGSRAITLVAIAKVLIDDAQKQDVLSQALVAAKAIENEWLRAETLVAVAAVLTDDAQKQNIVSHALAAAKVIKDDESRATMLLSIAQVFADSMQKSIVLLQASEAATAIEDRESRVTMLLAIAQVSTDAAQKYDVLFQAFETAKTIKDESSRAQALSAIFEVTGNDIHRRESLAAVKSIKYREARARALITMASILTNEMQKYELLSQALETAKTIEYDSSRANVLVAVTAVLADDVQKRAVLSEALAAAKVIKDEWNWAQALVAMVAMLTNRVQRYIALSETLAMTKVIKNEWAQAQGLVALLRILTDDSQKREVLVVAMAIEDDSCRAEVLTAVAAVLTDEEQKREILSLALAATKAIESEESRIEALVAVAAILTDEEQKHEILGMALAAAKAIESEESRIEALIAMAAVLTDEEQKHEILGMAKAIEDEQSRAQVLMSVAKILTDEVQKRETLSQAYEAAKAVKYEEVRAKMLAIVAGALTDDVQKQDALSRAFTTANSIQDKSSRAFVLATVAALLTDYTQKREVLEKIKALDVNAVALGIVVAVLNEQDKRAEIPAAFEASVYTNIVSERLIFAWESIRFSGFDRRWFGSYGLRYLARQGRSKSISIFSPSRGLLDFLAPMAPLFKHVGGDELLGEIIHAMRDVTTWWP